MQTINRSLLLIILCMMVGKAQIRVVPPEAKINPLNGTVVGAEKYPLSLDEVSWMVGDSLLLRAFPGEWKMVQVVLFNHPYREVQVGGEVPPGLRVFRVGLVRVKDKDTGDETFLPDFLFPVSFRDFRGRIPENSLLFPERAKYLVLWVEFRTDSTMAGTVYRGQFVFSGGVYRDSLNYVLQVKKTVLPPPACEIDLNEYGAKYLRAFGKKLSPGEEIRYEREVFRMVHQHGAVLNPLPYKSQRGTPRKRMAPKLVRIDSKGAVLDWSEFDARFGDYLSGRAFSDGHPLSHFYLPFNPEWPAQFVLYQKDRKQYEQIWQAVALEFIRHFQQKGWTQTMFQVYCNQKPGPKNNIPWNLDEPKGVDDYRALRYYCDLTHHVFEGSEPVQVRFRVDISHFYCEEHRGSRRKDFRVNGGDTILAPVDIWVISHHSLKNRFAVGKAQELVAKGKWVYEYGNTPTIPAPGWQNKQPIFRVWQYGFQGFLAWRTFEYGTSVGTGKNFLLYAVRLPEAPGIYPSLRFKLLKRALDETRVFDLAIQKKILQRKEIVSMLRKQNSEYFSPEKKEMEIIYRKLP